MTRSLMLALGLLLLATLTFTCLRRHTPEIQADIQQKVAQELQAHGYSGTHFRVSGRDVILTGEVPDAEALQSTIAMIENLEGVRRVESQATILPATRSDNGSAPSAYYTQIDFDGQHIALSGQVPDNLARSAILLQAEDLVGAPNLVDELSVREGAPDNWGDTVSKITLAAIDGLEHLVARVEKDSLQVRGYAASSLVKDTVEQRLRDSLPEGMSLSFMVEAPREDSEISTTDLAANNSAEVNDQAPQSNPPADPTTKTKAEPTPPTTSAADCQARVNALLRKQTITFDTSSDSISQASLKLITQLASVADSCPDLKIEIAGHTDTRGEAEMNRILSQKRAESVRKALIQKGVAGDRLSAKGYGETHPIAKENTAGGLEKNRRIELKIQE